MRLLFMLWKARTKIPKEFTLAKRAENTASAEVKQDAGKTVHTVADLMKDMRGLFFGFFFWQDKLDANAAKSSTFMRSYMVAWEQNKMNIQDSVHFDAVVFGRQSVFSEIKVYLCVRVCVCGVCVRARVFLQGLLSILDLIHLFFQNI